MNNKRLSEALKIDVALQPRELAAAPTDTDFFSMRNYGKALFCVELGAMADGDTVVITALESDDNGATSQLIDIGTAAAPVNVTDTVTASQNITAGQLDTNAANELTAGDDVTITIDGEDHVFTADGTPVAADREFAPGATGEESAVNLAALINGEFGIEGVVATASAPVADNGRVVIEFEDKGENTMTVDASGGANQFVPSTNRAIAYIEVAAEYLSDGYDSVGLRVQPDAAIDGGVVLVRGAARYNPSQNVAASDTTRRV